MPLTNPSQQLYGNMKALTSKLRQTSSEKASANNKNDGIMLRRSMPNASTNNVQENEEVMKIAKILMKLEDQRNGTA
ncbi:MAG: hypothetical protein CML81_00095 [Rhodobiaceae bacterium]|nr:hypothetical protein [Rhodobiaceae bacterium]RPF98078.1 MAG: hypothetical protein CBD87_000090 [Rhizobiales bacterium TMED227]|tara:strand:+ start:117 stop:347 length:231 start_codon:yes stop_codon:yes gene_type:complete